MATTASDLRRIALEEFAASGYLGTSLQHIAARAGVSKASVLYHYSSKEVLLEAALSPAIERLREVVGDLAGLAHGEAERIAFLERFVDFLLEHRLAVYIFVNQSGSLEDVPVIERANAEIERIADYFAESEANALEKMRFGVALGGAAYLLASVTKFSRDQFADAELRDGLVRLLGELLAPVPSR